MYKKYGTMLLLCNLILMVVCFNIKGIQINRLASTPAFQLKFSEDFIITKDDSIGTSFMRLLKGFTSGQRIINCEVLEKNVRMVLSQEDYQALLRIVQAEAGGEDEKGKILVANVVLNRVESNKFPDTVKEVVLQQNNGVSQFSPVANGKYHTVVVSEETKEAVDKALSGVDISKGALYFVSRKHADPSKMEWFDNHLTLLFSYGGHEFFL